MCDSSSLTRSKAGDFEDDGFMVDVDGFLFWCNVDWGGFLVFTAVLFTEVVGRLVIGLLSFWYVSQPR